jgi:hypothetical protein
MKRVLSTLIVAGLLVPLVRHAQAADPSPTPRPKPTLTTPDGKPQQGGVKVGGLGVMGKGTYGAAGGEGKQGGQGKLQGNGTQKSRATANVKVKEASRATFKQGRSGQSSSSSTGTSVKKRGKSGKEKP